jgi:hypothetical protein
MYATMCNAAAGKPMTLRFRAATIDHRSGLHRTAAMSVRLEPDRRRSEPAIHGAD